MGNDTVIYDIRLLCDDCGGRITGAVREFEAWKVYTVGCRYCRNNVYFHASKHCSIGKMIRLRNDTLTVFFYRMT